MNRFSILALGLAVGPAVYADVPVATEPFEYLAGTNPANGGTGWAQPWQIRNVGNVVVTPGLTYPGIPATGNAMGPTVGGSFISRPLATPIDDTTNLSMLLAVLIRPLADGTPLSFSAVGNFGGSGGFSIGDLASTSSAGANWGLATVNGLFFSDVPVTAATTTLLVGRIDYLAGNDRMRLWVNPAIDSSIPLCDALFALGTAADVDTTNSSITSFSGVFFQNTNNTAAEIDEIVVCVRPVPAPATAALLGGLTAFGLLRGKRRAQP